MFCRAILTCQWRHWERESVSSVWKMYISNIFMKGMNLSFPALYLQFMKYLDYLMTGIPWGWIMSRAFANRLGDWGSVSGRVIPKTKKTVLDDALLSTQHYKVRIKGKVKQSLEWSSALFPHPDVVAIEKGAFGSRSTKVTNSYIYIYIYIYIYTFIYVYILFYILILI